MKKFIKQLQLYLWIRLSIFAGIDDFSCNSNWDSSQTLWDNAGNMVKKDYESRRIK